MVDDILIEEDLPKQVQEHELVSAMVAGANARARRVAPCLWDEDKDGARAEAKLILLGAVQRWSEAGAGALSQVQAGPFQMSTDNRSRSGFNLWPSEIEELQALCAGAAEGAFAVDTVGFADTSNHAQTCSLVFGGGYCSCGASLTKTGPLWGDW